MSLKVQVLQSQVWSVKFEMRKYKSVDFEDSRSFSGRVHCTRYQISAGANAPAAPVLDPPLSPIHIFHPTTPYIGCHLE